MNNHVIYTSDLRMKEILKIAEQVALSRATILIQGESGTGKELLARFIHSKSSRSEQRLVAVNCAALPDNLLESELFGYEKGAFTGADTRKPGKFELASGSSFLLDEISELPLILQSKLLRVIQEGEVERLGGIEPKKVNFRLITTSNKDLEQMVSQGTFRQDLFFRLNVVPISIPPLRSRPKDIERLSSLFVENSCLQNGLKKKQLGESAIRKLLSWKWPGNVRELQNVIERSILLSGNPVLLEEDILIQNNKSTSENHVVSPGMKVSEVERMLILKTLEYTKQNKTKAADLLGISVRTLRNKVKEYGELNIKRGGLL